MDQDMLSDFYVEAEELYAEAEDALLDLEKSNKFEENYNSIFRAFHSVKGAAGMCGLVRLQEHMHYLENLLEKKKVDGYFSETLVDYLLSSVDCAKKIATGENVDFNYFDPDSTDDHAQIIGKEGGKTLNEGIITSIRESIEKRKNIPHLNGHVFVVDDEDDILVLTRSFLEEAGYQVSTFDKAQDALAVIKESAPDVVVTDINMPEMNGVEFMKKVNKMMPHLPIIVASGYVTKDVCLDSLASGVSGIVEKPYDISVFSNIVDLAVERYRAFKLLNKSLDLIVYQFEDLDKYLEESGLNSKRKVLREELKTILKQKKILVERFR
jgi:CheY-like chemotaxis protein/HPt (histidine-containing phosphotransfer) domain-containing protein